MWKITLLMAYATVLKFDVGKIFERRILKEFQRTAFI